MIERCDEAGLPPPDFEERQGFLIVTFKASMVEGGILEEVAQKTSDMILAILAENASATVAQMSEEHGIHTGAVEKHQRNLKRQRRSRRIGPDKGDRG